MTALTPSKPSTAAAEMLVDGIPGWLDAFGRQHTLEEAASLIEQQTRAGRLAADLAVLVQEFAWQRDRLRRMLDKGEAEAARAALHRMGEGNHALIAARRTLRELSTSHSKMVMSGG